MSNNRKKLKVIGWTKYSQEYRDWGETHPEESEQAELVVMNEIKRRKFKFGGNYHQYGQYGCPVMSDGSVFMVSMRHWGGIMATVWGDDYCTYAWSDVNDLKGGKAPTQADSATAEKWTKQELEEREKRRAQAAKEMQEARAKNKREQEKRKREDQAELRKYLSGILDKYDGRKDDLVRFLTGRIFEIADKYHCKPMNAGMKWVLYKSERERLRKESAENFKKLWGSYKAQKNESCDGNEGE